VIKLFILFANILLPLTAFLLARLYPKISCGWFFSIGIFAHVSYRMWETFYTSKEREPHKFEGDWTLAVGTLAYIGLCFLIVFEFFLIPRARSVGIVMFGGFLYLLAARLRFWGELTLGSQWAVHVVGNVKTSRTKLLKIGPYKYIRHPIYFGILLEEIALPLLANTFFSLGCTLLVNIPLLLIRLVSEEKVSSERFGNEYKVYANTAGMFFPKAGHLSFIKELLSRLR